MDHPTLADEFVADGERAHWHDGALWFVRSKRDTAASLVPEWEQLRSHASAIKAHSLSRIGEYLEQFAGNAAARGATVHWAKDGAEHNRIVQEILQRHDAKRVVKSKSMLTEECGLNPHLASHGIEVVDTDLGERIVQLRKEEPSHIVLPAIHIKKEEVGDLFHEQLGTDDGASDPQYLTEAARHSLREELLAADAAITGVNFAIAETGGVVVCTNEGNADMGTGLSKLHIACMGFEKLVPRVQDLGVFTRLLARSATGQSVTSYTTHYHGANYADDGGELHIVIVDNGRTDVLQKERFRRSLHCIRCGACMNTCPVYRRSGGHSYNYTVPGPIGSILAPSRDPKEHYSLPFASSLCGSCTNVCPVKIDLHHQLLAWREEIAAAKVLPWRKRMAMKMLSLVLRNAWLYRTAGGVMRRTMRLLPRGLVYNRMNGWGRQRELPPMPKRSFRDLYRQEKRSGGSDD